MQSFKLALVALVLSGSLLAEPAKVSPRQQVAEGEVAFAFDLYSRLAKDKAGNVAVSPAGAHRLLTALWLGAQGDAKKELSQVLGLPDEETTAGVRAFTEALTRTPANFRDEPAYKVTWVEGLWAPRATVFKDTYTRAMAMELSAETMTGEFADNDRLLGVITQWGLKESGGKLKAIVPRVKQPKGDGMLLVGGFTLSSVWMSPFDKSKSDLGDFRCTATRSVRVVMMKQTHLLGYFEDATVKAVELPYTMGEITCTLITGVKPDGLAELEQDAKGKRVLDILGRLEHRQVTLTMPRFRLVGDSVLRSMAGEMGLKRALEGSEDLSGITAKGGGGILEIRHHATLSCEEAGSDATGLPGGVSMALDDAGAGPKSLTLDRPFLVVLRHRETGCMLFIGRVSDPSERAP